MVRRSVLHMRVVALASLLWIPASLAFGQGISGVVRDTSGGVLPGVTVEASMGRTARPGYGPKVRAG